MSRSTGTSQKSTSAASSSNPSATLKAGRPAPGSRRTCQVGRLRAAEIQAGSEIGDDRGVPHAIASRIGRQKPSARYGKTARHGPVERRQLGLGEEIVEVHHFRRAGSARAPRSGHGRDFPVEQVAGMILEHQADVVVAGECLR